MTHKAIVVDCIDDLTDGLAPLIEQEEADIVICFDTEDIYVLPSANGFVAELKELLPDAETYETALNGHIFVLFEARGGMNRLIRILATEYEVHIVNLQDLDLKAWI
ncbi:hypothetical protein A2382_02520 [Candidatus Woesebacteria bacterium RIFOXYB1_FULL_38_16]|uniref:Uncharacterized protein n=1 Tax=Candidatus Woesebacteria bacterium RIFOXYB1_FULL_38_16 TaxID=1802538 RepID=A0A1F8CSW8_9BACT|nr:MAG: hypothetical protein A2191_02475 [Candidatus Woesebacteria bacterium RIFOXYA1_FULL_38_9]OGM79361.1 MAG: hypothetical protein A2382_02520 [Candidatus Woesebacteria bacterium RIFOXYB1_FULL_38_16]